MTQPSGTNMSRALLVMFAFGILVADVRVAFAFTRPSMVTSRQNRISRRSSELFSIDEWRDLSFNFPGTGDDRRLGTEQGGLPRQVNILPFPVDEVLLQGETKQLRLYEDRFLKLFEDTMSSHCGVVAMGLLAAENGIIQTVPLCEVEAFNRMEEFGIFVTIRAVGRARLVEVIEQEPFISAVCLEISDKIPPSLELPNLLATQINQTINLLSQMEGKYSQAKEDDAGKFGEDDDATRRRIKIAKLDDKFYEDLDEEDEGEEPLELDRSARFQRSLKVAQEFDTCGYKLINSTTSSSYSAKELTAISWAAFCSEILPEEDDTKLFRIQAMDCDNLFDRLKLATQMLGQKEKILRAKFNKAGIKFRRDDGSEADQDGSS